MSDFTDDITPPNIPIQFSAQHAYWFGVNEAILLDCILLETRYNEQKGRFRDEDGTWAHFTEDWLSERFPFWDKNQIGEICFSLCEQQVIEIRAGVDDYQFLILLDYVTQKGAWQPISGPPKKTGRSGYVYLLQSQHGVYKIGKSVDPDTRIKNLGVVLPFEIKPIHLIFSDDYSKAERYLHEKYAHKRLNGEWFRLDSDDVKFIMSLKEI